VAGGRKIKQLMESSLTHQPTFQDLAADWRRCVYASFADPEFASASFRTLFNHGLKLWRSLESQLNEAKAPLIQNQLAKAVDSTLPPNKRRESLLTAATLVQSIL